MKKIWIAILLVFFPTILFSQWWSFAGSVSGGISEITNDNTKYYTGSKGKVGIDISLTARYSIWWFYVSSGVGYQALKSESGYVVGPTKLVEYHNVHPEFSYSNIYIPATIGFSYERWKVYPIVEAGVNVGFPVSLEDRLEDSGMVTTRHGEPKSVVIAFVAQGGVGYAFNDRFALEAKLRYTSSGSASKYKDPMIGNYKSTWQYIGGQVSFVVKLNPY